jgi:hypothetical protein
MRAYWLVRCLFVAVVIYSASLIRPVDGHLFINAGLGFLFGVFVVLAELW